MTRRVGTTANVGLVGGWSGPYVQVPFVADTWYRYRLRIEATQIPQKMWLDGQPEPADWTAIDVAPEGQFLSFANPTHLWIMNANYGVKLYMDWIGLRP